MTKIIFITSGKIDYILPGRSLYESIERTAMGKEFPHLVNGAEKSILKSAKLLKAEHPVAVFSAPSFQAKETANIIAEKLGLKVTLSKYLLPLRFNIKGLLTIKEFEGFGDRKFDILRERLLGAFFQNKLTDKNTEIRKRYEKLRKEILEKYKGKTVVVVSHAYLIKFFDIYNQIGTKMYKDKRKLFSLFKPERETMKRLETLTISY